jgi:hypothetical protein
MFYSDEKFQKLVLRKAIKSSLWESRHHGVFIISTRFVVVMNRSKLNLIIQRDRKVYRFTEYIISFKKVWLHGGNIFETQTLTIFCRRDIYH